MDKLQVEAFLFRLWNTFKVSILPAVALVIINDMNTTPDSLAGLTHWHLWEKVLFAVLTVLLSSVLAGADKVYRNSKNTKFYLS